MTPPSTLTIEAATRESIPVDLVGKRYSLVPPKTTLAIQVAAAAQSAEDLPNMMKSLEGWVVAAFGTKSGNAIVKRLYDPNDALDVDHIVQLVQGVMGMQTGNPTT